MRRLDSFNSRMKFVVAITLFIVGTLALVGSTAAKQWFQLQKRYTADQVQSACIKANGRYTAGIGSGGYGCKTRSIRVSCNRSGVCVGTDKGIRQPLSTTVIARQRFSNPGGVERPTRRGTYRQLSSNKDGDVFACVGECRVVTMCLLEYCVQHTVCNECARQVYLGNKYDGTYP